MNRFGLMLAAGLIASIPAVAQNNSSVVSTQGTQYLASADFHKIAEEVLAKAAASPSHSANSVPMKYSNHAVMIAARTGSGIAELHTHDADVILILKGEVKFVTGGTVQNPKEISPGEIRGDMVLNGNTQVLHAGDLVHVEPNTPHQMFLAPGMKLSYLVIKATE